MILSKLFFINSQFNFERRTKPFSCFEGKQGNGEREGNGESERKGQRAKQTDRDVNRQTEMHEIDVNCA